VVNATPLAAFPLRISAVPIVQEAEWDPRVSVDRCGEEEVFWAYGGLNP
jgi:hypothetical protein